jgi:hypothetical protein
LLLLDDGAVNTPCDATGSNTNDLVDIVALINNLILSIYGSSDIPFNPELAT